MTLADKLKRSNVKIKTGPSYPLRPELLLHPNVPKPLHQVAPRTVLGAKWWGTERKACYAKAEYYCECCGVHKLRAAYHQWLEAHETYAIDYAKGRAKYLGCVALCHFCHNYIHSGRLQALLEKGEIHQAKYVAILQHGDRILATAGLGRASQAQRDAIIEETVRNGGMAEWGKWRLVIGRKHYPPKFKSVVEWESEMSK